MQVRKVLENSIVTQQTLRQGRHGAIGTCVTRQNHCKTMFLMLLRLFYNIWYTNQVIIETYDPTTTKQFMNCLTELVWIYHDSTTSLQYNWCTGSTELNIQGKSH